MYIYKYNYDEAVYHTKLKLKATERTCTGGWLCACIGVFTGGKFF